VQPHQSSWFRKSKTFTSGASKPQGSSGQFPGRKPITCYSCGKSGHVSRECWSRSPGEAVTAPVATAAPAAPTGTRAKPEVVCFRCKGKGHKSPDCPTRPKGNRRVQMPGKEPMCLASEELFGYIGKWGMSMTIDTGAQVSIVPIECVEPDQLLGVRQKVRSFQGALVEGEACNVEFLVGDRVFKREAVGIKGDLINWTPCLRVLLSPREDMDYVMRLAEEKVSKDQQLYQPLRYHNGKLRSRYLVSEGDVSMLEQEPCEGSVMKSGKAVKKTNEDVIQSSEEEVWNRS